MNDSRIEQAQDLITAGDFRAALPLLREAAEAEPGDWQAWYLAGQCCRFTGDADGALVSLHEAARLGPSEAPVWLALSIACQAVEDWSGSVAALRRALAIDPDYYLAINSLAITQRRSGEAEKALHNFDAAAKALCRCLLGELVNDSGSPILEHEDVPSDLWLEHVCHTALSAVAQAELDQVRWPTAEMAEREERTRTHGGLYWVDGTSDEGASYRLFLPNFFNTMREGLRRDGTYSMLMRSRGRLLQELGRSDEAARHFADAELFDPAGRRAAR